MEETILTVDEYADKMRITKKTVYGMIKRGDIRAKKTGREYRIIISDGLY